MTTELRDALQIIVNEHTDDIMVYHIRECEGKGWDGPRVVNFAHAFDTVKEFLNKYDEIL